MLNIESDSEYCEINDGDCNKYRTLENFLKIIGSGGGGVVVSDR